jgi:hypothetical protein
VPLQIHQLMATWQQKQRVQVQSTAVTTYASDCMAEPRLQMTKRARISKVLCCCCAVPALRPFDPCSAVRYELNNALWQHLQTS